ncbi:unnamed protein product [Ectocarpus sp. 13 AM-2016]
MMCVFSLVQVGVLKWALVAWGFFGSLLFVSFFRLVRLVNGYAIRSNTARRRRQRIPRGALEARLQLHHPGIELGRLRLLLVDRDFTGEDYQALLDLDDNNDVPSTVGASEGEIRRNPSFVIPEPAADSVVKPKNCSICLYPFKPREREVRGRAATKCEELKTCLHRPDGQNLCQKLREKAKGIQIFGNRFSRCPCGLNM